MTRLDSHDSNKVQTVTLFGWNVSKLNMADTVARLVQTIEQRNSAMQVVTANPHIVMHALEHPDYHRLIGEAELIVPDGTGLVWAAARFGTPVPERVAGFDLFTRLLEAGNERQWRVYMLGATREIVDAAAAKLNERYPNVTIGYRDGFFDEAEDERVIEHIRSFAPHVLFVARSYASTQDPWIARYKDKLRVPVMMGVGGTFDIVAGKLRRAPLWMQRMRLEWLYRTLQEPKRFGRLKVLPKFIIRVLAGNNNVRHPREHE